MAEIARSDLMEILVEMNTSLVDVIKGLLTSGQVLFSSSDYDAWNRVGVRTTNATVNTLAQLYQRKLQSDSVPRVMTVETLDDEESDYKPSNDDSSDDEPLSNEESDDEGFRKINEKFSDGSSYIGQVKDDLYHG